MQKSIRRFIFSILSVVLLLLFVMYSVIALIMLDKGTDVAIVWAFDEIVKDYNLALQVDANAPLPQDEFLWIKKHPEQLPDKLAEAFSQTQFEQGYQNIPWRDSRYIIGIKPLHDGNRVYLAADIEDSWQALEQLSDDAWRYIYQFIVPLLFTFIISIILAVIVIAWMTITFLRPLQKMAAWVEHLTPELAKQPAPDFSFIELNAVARPFQQSLLDIERMIAKEQFFMRATSHELRTPLAVASANVELLNKLLAKAQLAKDCEITVARIERAVIDMGNITEAVLWLGREEQTALPSQQVDLAQTVKELVDGNYYLIAGKDITFNLQLTDCNILAPLTPCKMVISNLIRNAMQYTQQGIIDIRLSATALTIRNKDISDMTTKTLSSDYGFGLGLMVVERICDLMQWQYQHQMIAGGREVKLQFV